VSEAKPMMEQTVESKNEATVLHAFNILFNRRDYAATVAVRPARRTPALVRRALFGALPGGPLLSSGPRRRLLAAT
jgi:hypothetical protein